MKFKWLSTILLGLSLIFSSVIIAQDDMYFDPEYNDVEGYGEDEYVDDDFDYGEYNYVDNDINDEIRRLRRFRNTFNVSLFIYSCPNRFYNDWWWDYNYRAHFYNPYAQWRMRRWLRRNYRNCWNWHYSQFNYFHHWNHNHPHFGYGPHWSPYHNPHYGHWGFHSPYYNNPWIWRQGNTNQGGGRGTGIVAAGPSKGNAINGDGGRSTISIAGNNTPRGNTQNTISIGRPQEFSVNDNLASNGGKGGRTLAVQDANGNLETGPTKGSVSVGTGKGEINASPPRSPKSGDSGRNVSSSPGKQGITKNETGKTGTIRTEPKSSSRPKSSKPRSSTRPKSSKPRNSTRPKSSKPRSNTYATPKKNSSSRPSYSSPRSNSRSSMGSNRSSSRNSSRSSSRSSSRGSSRSSRSPR